MAYCSFFVYLANSWLHGRLDLGQAPPHGNDWAQVEELRLADGRHLRGAFVTGSAEMFRTTRGEIVHLPREQVAERKTKYYVSFPPFPAMLMAPLVAVWGLQTNDVIFTVAVAALAPALFFLLLGRLRRRGDSSRSLSDELWLTGVLAFGTVFYYSSVLGQVWYTAHVVSVPLMTLFVLFSLDARRPVLAGLCVVFGFMTRPELLFSATFFLWELARVSRLPDDAPAPEGSGALVRLRHWWRGVDRPRLLRGLVLFGLPIAAFGMITAWHNWARFDRLTAFGHEYLNVRWTPRIQKFGLFNYAFLGRNLACLLALTPRVVRGYPWVQVSWHGLAIWVTTPVLLWLLWPKVKGALHRPLWIATACMAIPNLLYQNSGWVQFGYRFSLDYIVLLLCLMAIGGRRFGKAWKVLAIVGVIVNLFGAITFDRAGRFYFDAFFPPGID